MRAVIFILLLSGSFLFGCAHQQKSESATRSGENYDLVISKHRSALAPSEFQNWLVKERQKLEAQKEGIEGALYSTGARGSYQEAGGAPSTNGIGTESFDVQMTNLELKRMQDRLKQVERNIRTVNALILAK